MNPEQQKFIAGNFKKLSARQMARQMGLSRTEIERFIEGLAKRKVARGPEKSASKTSDSLIAFFLFLIALALRLCYIFWLKNTPFFEPLSAKLDDGVYDQMGQSISAGNWIGDLPYAAYRIPLYPYFLAVIYSLFGRHLFLVHVIQSGAGALSVVLLYFITKKAFNSRSAGLIAGVLACVYLPFIFFENLLLGESLSIFLNLSGLLLLTHALDKERGQGVKIAGSGILFGLSVLLRPNTLLPVLFLAAFIAYTICVKAKKIQKGALLSLLFLVGAATAMAPITVKNYFLYKDFLPVSAVGGVNFYIGNNPEADGKFHLTKGIGTGLDEMIVNSQSIAEKEMGRTLKPSEASSYWMKEAVAFIISSPGEYLRLLIRKTLLFFNRYEFPDILDIQFTAQFIPLLYPGSFLYGIILVFAVFGVVRVLRSGRNGQAAQLLLVFFAGYFLSVILFFITARYRLPAVAVLLPFSAFAITHVIACFKKRALEEIGSFLLVAIPAGIIAFWPVEVTTFGANYNSLAIAMKNRGDFEAAEKYYKKAMQLEPNYPSPYYNLALLYEATGRSAESAPLRQKYNELRQKQY